MEPSQILLYVNDLDVSREFYRITLGYDLIDTSPTFSVAALKNGWTIALLARDGKSDDGRPVGGFELVIDLSSREAVEEFAATLRSGGIELEQEPTDMPFGYALVVRDPDGVSFRVGYFPKG